MAERFNISNINSYRENNRLEVKTAREQLPSSFWETYSAFANTEGGCILLGVKERPDKTWYATGIDDVDKMKKELWDLLHNPNKTSACLLTEKNVTAYELDGHQILAVEIPRAKREQKPVYINHDLFSGTYRRDWEGDYCCSREAVLAMLRDQTDATPDMKVLENKEIKDFNQDSIRSYRIRYNTSHDGHPWTELPDDEFLLMIGAASDETSDHRIHPTAAGLLMFGFYHRIMTEFPDFLLDYYEISDPAIRWTDRFASHSGDWSGNIYDFFTKVYLKLTVDLKRPFQLEDGLYRRDDTPVHKAVREALANCLVNADYLLPASVVVKKYPDRIVFSNPGTIRPGRKQMLRGGLSMPRNRVILNMLNYIGVGERAGSGVPDIYSVWKQENYLDPIVEELSGREGTIRTVVTLPLVQKDSSGFQALFEKGPEKGPEKRPETKTDEMTARCEAVLNAIKRDPKMPRPRLAAELNLTEKQVRAAIEKLREDGTIHYDGSDRDGHWVIKS